MAQYHINPRTGDVGACRALVECPFGDINEDHYASVDEARAAYEARQASTSPDPTWKKVAYGYEFGPVGVMPNTRVGGWTVFELQEVDGKMVPFTPHLTVNTLTAAKNGAAVLARRLAPQPAAEESPATPKRKKKYSPKPARAALSRPLNNFDKDDFHRLYGMPGFKERVQERYEEISQALNDERDELEKTPEGRAKLEEAHRKSTADRRAKLDAIAWRGRGTTYYYISKAGTVRETHTKGSAAVGVQRGFGTAISAQAHRDVVVEEFQAHGFTKKEALQRLFDFNTHELD